MKRTPKHQKLPYPRLGHYKCPEALLDGKHQACHSELHGALEVVDGEPQRLPCQAAMLGDKDVFKRK